MTADAHFSPNVSQKLTHLHLFTIFNIARPSQRQLSTCSLSLLSFSHSLI